jgi:uncharacterized Tic20 family protein
MSTPPGWYPPPPGWQPPAEDTTWAVLAHLSFFAFGLIAPLVIYLVKKDESPFTRHHAAEALNFIAGAVLAILAAIAASRREAYRYPLTIRFVS